MYNKLLLLTVLWALALTACDSSSPDDDDMMAGEAMAGEEMAGEAMAGEAMAGEAMAGEAMAGEAMAGEAVAGEVVAGDEVPSGDGNGTCGEPYEFTENEDGSFTAEGVLNGDDSVGSCSSEVDLAEDAVLIFTAPEAGTYIFDTLQSFGLDSVIYAQNSCGDAMSEIEDACNDDFGDAANGEVQSEIILQLDAGQTVFLVVDSFNTQEGSEGASFSASIRKVEVTTPELSTAQVVFNTETFLVASNVTGVDAGGDVEVIGFIFTVNGEDLEAIEVSFSDFGDISFDGDAFEGTMTGGLDETYLGLTAAKVYVIDSLGAMSNMVEATVEMPAEIALGDACDQADAFSACASGTLCIPESEEVTTGLCTEVFSPSVTSAMAGYNADLNTLSIQVSGVDLTEGGADIDFIEVTFLDGEGADLLQGPNALSVKLTVDETDNSQYIATFGGPWIDPEEGIAAPASVSVVVVDLIGLRSEPIEATVMMPVVVEAGEACDAFEALSVCTEGLSCLETCVDRTMLDPSCPEDYGVTDLTLDAPIMGDHTNSMVTASGSCGGGGTVNVYSFTASEAGTYHFIATRGDESVDTLMYARNFCSTFSFSEELACNDDIDADYNAGIELELEADATAYIFVDSYQGTSGGPYTITAASGSLPAGEE